MKAPPRDVSYFGWHSGSVPKTTAGVNERFKRRWAEVKRNYSGRVSMLFQVDAVPF